MAFTADDSNRCDLLFPIPLFVNLTNLAPVELYFFHHFHRGTNMPNLIDYVIENRAFRERFIYFMYPFTIIGGTLASISMLLARYYR
jgi:hypothetical protein